VLVLLLLSLKLTMLSFRMNVPRGIIISQHPLHTQHMLPMLPMLPRTQSMSVMYAPTETELHNDKLKKELREAYVRIEKLNNTITVQKQTIDEIIALLEEVGKRLEKKSVCDTCNV
jgi:phosphopantetheine adenylyltransferase